MLGLGTRAVSRLQRRCRCLALRFDTGPNSQLSTCGNGRHTRTSLYSEPPPQVTSNRAEPKTPGSTPTPVHSTPAQLNSAQHSQRSPRSPRRTVALLHCCTAALTLNQSDLLLQHDKAVNAPASMTGSVMKTHAPFHSSNARPYSWSLRVRGGEIQDEQTRRSCVVPRETGQ